MKTNNTLDKLGVQGYFLKEAKSGKAFLFAFCNEEQKEVIRKWVPYSQTSCDDGRRITAQPYRTYMEFNLPMWLCNREDITEIYRDEILAKEIELEDEYEGLTELDFTDRE